MGLIRYGGAGAILALCAAAACLGLCAADCSGDWLACRANLTRELFGTDALPSKAGPDYIIPQPDYRMSGFPIPGNGTGGSVSWGNNLTALVWTITSEHLTMNATVFHSLNTSGVAPSNYPPSGPHVPSPQQYASSIGDTLIIWHHGHETTYCEPNFEGVVDHLNELGYDVFEMMMPLIGCNQQPQYGSPHDHAWFQQWEDKGDYTMRFFILPVVYAVQYARTLGYKNIVMLGLSGGGWTTTVASAAIPGIDLSIPIAGSVPKWPSSLYPGHMPDMPEGHGTIGGDYEQLQERPFYKACGWVCLYVLAGLEEHRHQLQILHEQDSCCFRAGGQHDTIKGYNTFVQSHVQGWMQTAVTAGNVHEVNPRDKVLVALIVERLRRNGGVLTKSDFQLLPFDMLRVQ